MTQQTIKALYKQPVNYKLIKDGYKTINGVIQAKDDMPKVIDLPVSSELYTTDLQYTVDTEVNGAPIITTEQFTLPDNEICKAKEYCYASKGINYNYTRKRDVKYYDNFTIVGLPTITNAGVVSEFSNSNYLTIDDNPNFQNANSWEFITKVSVGSTSAHQKILFGCGINFGVTNSGYLHLWLDNNSAFVDSDVCSADLLSTNPFIKLSFNGTAYSCYISPDGETWTLKYVYSSTTKVLSSDYILRLGNYSSEYWRGTIDLSQTYIKIDNEIWWVPYTYHEEEITTQIPGILDSSVTTDDWQQSQEYKLYQLKNQNNTDTLQLTENGITDTTQKYKQYVDQLTIPARNYKWYYNGIPQHVTTNFWNYGAEIDQNNVATNFDGFIRTQSLSYMSLGSTEILIFFNIETGDISTDCVFFDMYNALKLNDSILFAIRDGKFSCNSYSNPTNIVYGLTNLSSNTKYWVGLYFNRTRKVTELYLLADNNYQKENLPHIFLWKKELTFDISLGTISLIPYIGAQSRRTQDLSNFTGKLYLNNLFATRTLTTSYDFRGWEAFSYSGYQYNWYANKSLYDYIENKTCADILDFSDSWLNVTNDWKTQKQYVNQEVCLMPIDGGETITTYSLNATEIGGINFNTRTGTVSGFSSNDYLQLKSPFNPGENPWEMLFKVRTGSNLQTWQEIFHSSVAPNESGRYGLSVMIDSGNFELDISTDGSSWIGSDHGTFVLSENTDYWIKIGWNSNEYYLEYSTNGVNYIRDITYTVSNNLPNLTNSWIGIYRNSNNTYPMLGSIDLSESYIKINDEIWWNGTSIADTKPNVYLLDLNIENAYNISGSIKVEDKIASDFASGSYIYSDVVFPAHNTWEYITKFKITDSSIYNCLLSSDSGNPFGFDLGISGNKIKWYIQYESAYSGNSISNTGKGTATINNNTWYWVKFGFDGSRYYSAYSTDGITYTNDYAYTSSTKCHIGSHMNIGAEFRASNQQLKGSVDLASTSMSVNGQVIWKPKAENGNWIFQGCLAAGATDDGTEQDWDVYYPTGYTQPILVPAGQTYSGATKVDTITIPAHRTWNYTAGGNWQYVARIDISDMDYTYQDGDLVLTEYTGSDANVTLPHPVI